VEAKQQADVDDPLRTKLLLFTEWLQIVRADPRLPAAHLPAQWPASAAEDVFRAANELVDEPARRMAEQLLDTVPDVNAVSAVSAVPDVHSSS
jgi:phenylacetic acid degradation operon negative regulatory protein